MLVLLHFGYMQHLCFFQWLCCFLKDGGNYVMKKWLRNENEQIEPPVIEVQKNDCVNNTETNFMKL